MGDEPQDWWKSAVVYQVYPRSFQDSDGDGVGDLNGIRKRLDHLEKLGIDVIWLSPVYRSPHADAGYDISDYEDIDPLFGTLADFDALLDDVHARGMKLVMDLVVNHTSDEHPWFAESRASRENAKRDWYIWRDPREGFAPAGVGAEPNNWNSFFSGPAWTWDEASGQYYLHLFHTKQPDLNWENPEVREAVYAMMRRWLDRGVDGFRMDVINLISKVPGLPDGEVAEGARFGNGFPLFATGPRVHEFLHEMHREVFEGRSGTLTVGEMPSVTPEHARLFTDPARAEVDMVFQFDHVDLDQGPGGKFDPQALPAGALAASFTHWQEALADVGWNSLYLGNHDQPRPVSRFGDDRLFWRESATALATMLHLQRGTPYVYQGEEIGMTNSVFADASAFRDVETLNHLAEVAAQGGDVAEEVRRAASASRDNARTPVQWDASPTAGFTTGEPWIAVSPYAAEINAEAQDGHPGSVFEHYRALIALRHELPVVAHGSFARIDAGDDAIFAFERAHEGVHLLVVTNLSSQPRRPVFAPEVVHAWHAAEQVLTNVDGEARVDAALAPWEARVRIR